MARPKMKVCSVSGIKTSENNLRRNSGATKEQIMRMFNQMMNY